ncbi:HD domain-containing phosphohydrolase [Spirochaeta cellobiosiphila]|uniref:HD domain-containing phosphohydrolase n=1 Tax=Spirochaeta cellobiosiphila TaxID=504483 RepID=UPI000422FF95|nr:HD domain-containing phosphohydrolase [Spirochaeta cellobiosiphila]
MSGIGNFEKSKAKILMIDDTRTNLFFLQEALEDYENLYTASNGSEGYKKAQEILPDIILTDIVMPKMDGFECLKALKGNPFTLDIPVIILSTLDKLDNKTRGFALGAVDYITKPFDKEEVKARVDLHLSLKFAQQRLTHQKEYLEALVLERTKEVTHAQEAIITALASLAETRDNETGCHIKRTKLYVEQLALGLRKRGVYVKELDEQTIHIMAATAPLHDIGKVGVPDKILLKPGKLTAEEFEEMKKHTIYGYQALEQAEAAIGKTTYLAIAKKIAISHHEKWDGSGYPYHLKGQKIPLPGRIMAVADVYDALISERVYKIPFPHSKAVSIIKEGGGSHFDPAIVDVFLEIAESIRQIALENVEGNEEKLALQK